jgi:NAD-dependent dihydropyrimidine dehydrogenase PreA subunit
LLRARRLLETMVEGAMAYIITEPCIGTCDTSCVKVCPVDCIHTETHVDHKKFTEAELDRLPDSKRKQVTAKLQLYIDPEVCIDCGACEPECPVDAIFEADSVPGQWRHYIEINAAYFRR